MKLVLFFLVAYMYCTNTLATPLSNKDPEHNFEVFWEIFNDHYAHFENREVDWKRQYDRFRPKVNANTTDKELLVTSCA